MKFTELVGQVRSWLEREQRVTYRTMQREFELDDATLADLTAELIDAKRVAVDENGKVLVWIGASPVSSSTFQVSSAPQPPAPETPNPELQTSQSSDAGLRTRDAGQSAAERRQLTVMFCDLVGSTALSAQLDPEDYRAVVQRYQQTSAEVIDRHDGYIAQYLGDGLLVYFGYPVAHEDDAARGVRAGLELIEAMREQGTGNRVQGEKSLQVRIGIHTGLVVIGDVGTSGRTEQLAVGETPNLAARLQSLAEPNTVIISAATQRVVEGQFECQPFGSHLVKGIDTPIAVYHVQSERQSVSPLAGRVTLTPLVGREQEVGLLLDRWEQTKEGRGQVVLLSGEPGIGKSRLAYTLREHVTSEGSLLFEARCSPYHQQSALYPLIEVLQRTLLFTRQDTDSEKVEKLARTLALYNLQEAVPLFASLLSLPASGSALPAFSPQKQKERTLEALIQLLSAQAERQATVSVWEDVHWADPSSLEFLTLLIEQLPTSKLMLVLTFRPEFTPLWKPRSHISQLVLNRLGKKQVEVMIEKAAAAQELSAKVIEQIRRKTDGVPLFVEELTKSVVEARGQGTGDREQGGNSIGVLAIPATLQEALLARLDRLSEARQIAQLGATLGREFSHELIQAVTSLTEEELHAALTKLVEAEILYQRGIGEQAQYFFKHALIQDTAYQSLLKSTRQQYHTQIAQVLEKQFPHTKESQPELLAHHYTEAGLIEQAIPYWELAGERASQRSAHVEAIAHLTKGLELLKTLPDTPGRTQHELALQIALGVSLMATKGFAAPETGAVYRRARELCQHVGETPQLFPVLWGLWAFYVVRAELQTALELGEQCLGLARNAQDPALLVEAHYALGATLAHLGEGLRAREHFEQVITLYDPQHHRSLAFLYGGLDPEVLGRGYAAAWVLWFLGYPDQALTQSHAALTSAQRLAHPFSLVWALILAALLHLHRREGPLAQERAEAAIRLASEQGFVHEFAVGTLMRGGALVEQGQVEEGIAQTRQGLDAHRATGAESSGPTSLVRLAAAYGKVGQREEGLSVLTEALAVVDTTGERVYEAELYRIKGSLTLQQESKEQGAGSGEQEAEGYFLKAIYIARQQQAKSLELRAATSLARLWQQQGKRAEAHKLLSEVYNWFTEGFDTKDLQEAKALLADLAYEATINYHK